MNEVKTEVFEGPLEVLLSLVEKRKLFINDISLAKVADEYIETVRAMPELPIREVSNFVFVASTLVLIKSKSLLPALDLSSEETGDIEKLKMRLLLYQRIKELSLNVQGGYGKNVIRERETSKNIFTVFSPGEDVTVSGIYTAMQELILRLPKFEAAPQAVIKKMITLEDAMERLVKRIDSHLKMSFKKYSGIGREEKGSVIVAFLAVLELIKRGAIEAVQRENFSDFHIETRQIGVPKYTE